MNKKVCKKIAVFISNPSGIYSGGRYYSLFMSIGFVEAGYELYFVTNELPIFWSDLEDYEGLKGIKKVIGLESAHAVLPNDIDLVVVVPGTSNDLFYDIALNFCLSSGAKIALLNFESENWFNKYAEKKKPISHWKQWKRVASVSSLILSISEEGNNYAKEYYKEIVPQDCLFEFAYPPINTKAADREKIILKEKKIIILARFSGDSHKGSDQINRLIGSYMSGYTLAIVVGTGEVPTLIKQEIENACGLFNVKLKWYFKLTDQEKFKLFKESEFLLFPSLFEGYGYPPIEARYCECQVIAFDLPVLRETCGMDVIYVPHGNFIAFREAVEESIGNYTKPNGFNLVKTAHLSELSLKLNSIIKRLPEEIEGVSKKLEGMVNFPLFPKPEKLFDYFFDKCGKILRYIFLKFKRRTGIVSYYPRFSDSKELTSHYYRAAWYLPYIEVYLKQVLMSCSSRKTLVSDAPDYMYDSGVTPEHIRVIRNSWLYYFYLLNSDVILIWSESYSHRVIRWMKYLGIQVVDVTTSNVREKEYGNYPGIIWRYLLSSQFKESILEKDFLKFSKVTLNEQSKGKGFSAVFGTGPSLEKAFQFDFNSSTNIICNSIVQNQELLNHLNPVFVTAGDVVSHFGVSKYAAKFREDLLIALRTSDIHYFGTATFGYLLKVHFPELSEKILLIEQRCDGPNYDLIDNYSAPKLDSTMNIHMLPIASTLSNDIFILGCDGVVPTTDNEDFWAHASGAQYIDLVHTGHKCHPTFDLHRQSGTYSRHLNSVEKTLTVGEFDHGKRYVSLIKSYIPAFAKRSLSNEWYVEKKLTEGIVSIERIFNELPKKPLHFNDLLCDKDLPTKLTISFLKVNGNVVNYKGWCLSPHKKLRIRMVSGDNFLLYINRNIKRPDVLKAFPMYRQLKVGFEGSFELKSEVEYITFVTSSNGIELNSTQKKLEVFVD